MKNIFTLLFALLFGYTAFAQTDTSFWFVAPDCTFPGNVAANTESPVFLRLTSQGQPATVTITQPANPVFAPIVINIAASAVASVDLTAQLAQIENKPANQVLNKGLLIKSTTAITAYYEQSSIYNPDIFALKGANALGTYFLIPTQDTWRNNTLYTPPPPTNGFDIVATENNTSISITPSAAIVGHAAGTAFTITLQKGQTYSAVATGTTGAQHLAGTLVTASAPVAITTKDDFLTDPVYGTCSDLAGDQLVPVGLLGYKYIAIPGFLNGPNDKAFVMATQDGTTIKINGINVGLINSGQTINRASNGLPMFIEADRPVSVFHISGFGCEVGGALLPPIECTGSRNVGITRSDAKPIHLLLLVPAGGESGFNFNGNSTTINAGQFQVVPNTGNAWKFARIDISNNLGVGNSAYISNTVKEFHLGIIHGDAGGGCRYGYFSDYRGFVATASNNGPLCEGSNLQLSCAVPGTAGVSFQWSGPNGFASNLQNPSISNITLAGSGTYTCIASKANCASVTSRVEVSINPAPQFQLAADSPVCSGSNLAFMASGAGVGNGAQLQWSGPNGFSSNLRNPVINNATVSASGIYTLLVNNNGCSRSQSINVIVHPSNTAMAGNSGPYCEGQQLQLTGTSNNPAASYQWTGPGNFSSNAQNPVINAVQSAAAGTYNLVVSGGSCPPVNAATIVLVTPGPGASISGNAPVCEGQSLQMTGSSSTPGASFSWTGPGGFSSNNAQVNFNNASAANSGNYIFSVTKNGCTTSREYSAVVQARPIATPAVNSPICAGDTLRLTTTGNSGFGYNWTGPNGFTNTQQNPVMPNASSLAAGIYRLMVTAPGCPDAAGVVSVIVKAAPMATAHDNSPVCSGQSLLLTADATLPGTNFSWSGPGGYNSVQQQAEIVNAAVGASGIYVLMASNNGCSSTDTLLVTVHATPDAAIRQITPGCRNQVLQLENINTLAGSIYSWIGPAGFSSSDQQVNIAGYAAENAGKYLLKVTSNGCVAIDSIITSMLESPVITFTGVPGVCQDSAPFIVAAGETTGLAGSGSFSGPGITASGLFSPAIAGPGMHVVRYAFVASNGCSVNTVQEIRVYTTPQVNAGSDISIARGGAVTLSATSSVPAAAINWTPQTALTNNNLLSVMAVPDTTTTYYITVTSADGCTAKDSVLVKVLSGVYVPNAFSPNGDQFNPVWNIPGLEALPNCEVMVYNRYGQQVFYSRGYRSPWNGEFRGKPQSAGAYVYLILLNDGLRNTALKGSVILLR